MIEAAKFVGHTVIHAYKTGGCVLCSVYCNWAGYPDGRSNLLRDPAKKWSHHSCCQHDLLKEGRG